jgi:hypothetical protein
MSVDLHQRLTDLMSSIDDVAPWPKTIDEVTANNISRHIAVSGAIGGILLSVPDTGLDLEADQEGIQIHVFTSLMTATLLNNLSVVDPQAAERSARDLWTWRSNADVDSMVESVNELAADAGFDIAQQYRLLNESVIDYLASKLNADT